LRANALICGSIEHQWMGINGQFDMRDELRWRDRLVVGEANKGLNAMFTMMNDAARGRMQGLSQSEVGLTRIPRTMRASACRGRFDLRREGARQAGRSIIVHPDIAPALMSMKSFQPNARAR